MIDTRVAPLIQTALFYLKGLSEAQVLANFIAEICPNPRLAAVGISELILNAIEHGNLGITFEEKSRFADQVSWLQEVERRQGLPENQNKFVSVKLERFPQELQITVTDQGEGFNWRDFQAINPAGKLKSHGRGIAMAKDLNIFKTLQYSEKGNEVKAVIALT